MDIEHKYSIGEVCKILNCEQHNLRYIEKVLDLNIERENTIERSYSLQNVETLKMIFALKNEGLNYKAIKKVLERQEEVAVTSVPSMEICSDEKPIILENNTDYEKFLKQFSLYIEETIEKTILNVLSTNVNPSLDRVEQELLTLQQENKELRIAFEEMQEKHFKEIDDKLMSLREDKFKANKKRTGFFSRFFG